MLEILPSPASVLRPKQARYEASLVDVVESAIELTVDMLGGYKTVKFDEAFLRATASTLLRLSDRLLHDYAEDVPGLIEDGVLDEDYCLAELNAMVADLGDDLWPALAGRALRCKSYDGSVPEMLVWFLLNVLQVGVAEETVVMPYA